MPHVNFKKSQCRISLSLTFPNVTSRTSEMAMSHVTIIFSFCHMSFSPMSHVEFKKVSCRLVEFRGQGPYSLRSTSIIPVAIGIKVY